MAHALFTIGNIHLQTSHFKYKYYLFLVSFNALMYIFRFAIMVTVERLVAIRTPIRARTFWTPNRLITIIVIIYLLTVLFQIPHYLWYEPSSIPDCTNLNKTIPVLMQLPQSHKYYKLVKIAITICPMIIVTIPLILLISFNSLLLYHLRLSRKYVCEFESFPNQRSKDNERQITIMICVIVGTFFVFNFPSAVVFVCSVFEKDAKKIITLVTTSLATNYMVTLHKMFNFPLYCCSSSNFRKNLKRVFRGLLRRASGRWTNDTPTTNSVVNSFKSKSAGFGRQSLISNRKFVEIPVNVEQMRLL